MTQDSMHHDRVDIQNRYIEPLMGLTWLLFALLLWPLGIDWIWLWAVMLLLTSLAKIGLISLLNLNLTNAAYFWLSKSLNGVAIILALYMTPWVARAETNSATMTAFRFLIVCVLLYVARCIVGFVKSVRSQ